MLNKIQLQVISIYSLCHDHRACYVRCQCLVLKVVVDIAMPIRCAHLSIYCFSDANRLLQK